jgi:hypothetical protein
MLTYVLYKDVLFHSTSTRALVAATNKASGPTRQVGWVTLTANIFGVATNRTKINKTGFMAPFVSLFNDRSMVLP